MGKRIRGCMFGLAVCAVAAASARAQTFTEFTIPTAGSAPDGIAAGPDGALWFIEVNGNNIGRITTAGSFTEYAIPTVNAGATYITAGPDGAMWFSENKAIGRITMAGAITETTLPIKHTFPPTPTGIVTGPDGALWFGATGATDAGLAVIGRWPVGGAISEIAFPDGDIHHLPQGIAAGPDGALWFADVGVNKIGRITTGGVITEFDVPTFSASVQNIAAGPDGNLWFTEYNNPVFNPNNIGRITPAGVITEFPVIYGANSLTYGIVAGPDGAMWFTEEATGRIGRITTTGVVTEYPIPSGSGSQPRKIALGPDGALWFTERNTNKIGRLQIALNFEGKGYILDASLPAACASAGIHPNDEFTVVLKYSGGSVGIPPDTLAFYTEHSGAAAASTNASQSLASPGTLKWTYVTDRGFAGTLNSAGTSSMTLLTGLNAAITNAAGNIKIANGVINDFFGYAGCNIQNFHAALVVRPT